MGTEACRSGAPGTCAGGGPRLTSPSSAGITLYSQPYGGALLNEDKM